MPSSPISFFVFENGYFFPPVWSTVHMYPVKTVTDDASCSNTLCRAKSFENAGFLFTCGRTETEVFEYDDDDLQYDACSISDAIVFPSF